MGFGASRWNEGEKKHIELTWDEFSSALRTRRNLQLAAESVGENMKWEYTRDIVPKRRANDATMAILNETLWIIEMKTTADKD